jgi:hypothetical protein
MCLNPVKRHLAVVCASLLLGWATLSTGYAQSSLESEFQSWNMVTLTKSLGPQKKVLAYMEVFPWLAEDVGEVRILHLRPALGYKIRDNISIWQGYAWTPLIDPEFQNEHRFYQQLLISNRFKWFTLTNRSRLEERILQGAGGMSFRGVHLTRLDIPLGQSKKWNLVFFDQVFVNLNSVSGGPGRGFDQNMAFVGFNRKLGEHADMDMGYVNHYINRQVAPNKMNHALLVILTFRL